jgi:hypothetical protein
MIQNENNGNEEKAQGGYGGIILEDKRHVRTAAKMVSLGVVPTEQAESLLRQAFVLAARGIKNGETQLYFNSMKLILATAGLELRNEMWQHELEKDLRQYNVQINGDVYLDADASGKARLATIERLLESDQLFEDIETVTAPGAIESTEDSPEIEPDRLSEPPNGEAG